jgi:outer membrane protein OmpA-like peptidoglycan-associated protein
MKNSFWAIITVLGIVSAGMVGCASEGSVGKGFGALERQVKRNKSDIAYLKQSDEEQNEQLNTLMETVQDALNRAKAGGRVAKGRFQYHVTLRDEQVRFAFNKSNLSEKAKAVLDAFAAHLKSRNNNVFVEVQGHTDNVGSEAYNLMLGKERAKSIVSYLYVKHGISIHRMASYSYGESKPLVENNSPENRSKNRRVTLVVIK